MNTNLNSLTKAELAGLVAELVERVKVAEAKPAKASAKATPATPYATKFRMVKKGMGQSVRTPMAVVKDAEHAMGVSFAIWLDDNGAKRRAFDGGSWLLVDTRGITTEGITAIAKAWNAKATGKPVTGGEARDGKPALKVEMVLFTVANEGK